MNTLNPEYSHKDSRREITQLLTADIKQINRYSACKGASLGNHYHKKTVEYFYVLQGVVRYNDQSLFTKGDLFVVKPEENHTLECITDVELMSFLSYPYTEKDPDIWRKEP